MGAPGQANGVANSMLKAKTRTVVTLLLALAGIWVLATWSKTRASTAIISFACDGGADEAQFLFSQAETTVIDGARHITSDHGFVVYNIPTDKCTADRVYFEINCVGYHLQFSVDGEHWSTLAHFGDVGGAPERFRTQSCGFPAQSQGTSTTGTTYIRLSPPGRSRAPYPAIKSLRLQVSGPVPPAGFQRFSVKRELMALLPARLMFLVGLLSVIIPWRCWKTPLSLFGLGALLWTVSVAGKIGFALLANESVQTWLGALWPSSADLAFCCYLGLLTGVFECGIFLLIAGPLRRREWKWHAASSVGIGFGAAEAIVLGVWAAVGQAFQNGASVGPDVVSSLLAPVERLIALAVHTTSTVMIIYALARRKHGWFVAAFLYKSAIDAVAAFILLSTDLTSTRPWVVQLCLLGPFAYAGICILLALRRRW